MRRQRAGGFNRIKTKSGLSFFFFFLQIDTNSNTKGDDDTYSHSLDSNKHGCVSEHHVVLYYLFKTWRCLTLPKRQAVKIRKSPELFIYAAVL